MHLGLENETESDTFVYNLIECFVPPATNGIFTLILDAQKINSIFDSSHQ